MGIEIERKFLVADPAWKKYAAATKPAIIRQGYLSTDPEKTVRVRMKDQDGFLTIKGKTERFSRSEFEYKIPAEDAEALLLICQDSLIEKKRYLINEDNQLWEIDEFFGENSGLVIAEAELASEDQELNPPSWVGKEVTADSKYYNSQLAKKPYSEWQ